MLSRRRLLVSCGVLGLTYAARPLRAALALPNPEEVAARRRVARVVREYDAQGIHRTATDVDEASAEYRFSTLALPRPRGSADILVQSAAMPRSACLKLHRRMALIGPARCARLWTDPIKRW